MPHVRQTRSLTNIPPVSVFLKSSQYTYPFLSEYITTKALNTEGGGGSSILKVPGDVPPARVYFFGLLV